MNRTIKSRRMIILLSLPLFLLLSSWTEVKTPSSSLSSSEQSQEAKTSSVMDDIGSNFGTGKDFTSLSMTSFGILFSEDRKTSYAYFYVPEKIEEGFVSVKREDITLKSIKISTSLTKKDGSDEYLESYTEYGLSQCGEESGFLKMKLSETPSFSAGVLNRFAVSELKYDISGSTWTLKGNPYLSETYIDGESGKIVNRMQDVVQVTDKKVFFTLTDSDNSVYQDACCAFSTSSKLEDVSKIEFSYRYAELIGETSIETEYWDTTTIEGIRYRTFYNTGFVNGFNGLSSMQGHNVTWNDGHDMIEASTVEWKTDEHFSDFFPMFTRSTYTYDTIVRPSEDTSYTWSDEVKSYDWLFHFRNNKILIGVNGDLKQSRLPRKANYVIDTDGPAYDYDNVAILRLWTYKNGEEREYQAADKGSESSGNDPESYDTPDKTLTSFEEFMEKLGNWFASYGMIIVYVLLGILVIIFLPWIMKILKYVGKGLLFILKVLWKVLSWPFKAIAKAVSKKKGE